jgi:hypothetical protein
MSDADSTADTEDVIRVKPGSSRSSTIAAFYRQLDDWYSGRSAEHVQVESDQSDTDTDVRSDERLGSGPDDGEADSVSGGGASDQGDGSSSTELGRSEVDEGAAPDPDNTSVTSSGTDVESASAERAESESIESEGEQGPPRFHFAPLFHSRGDRID